MLEDQGVKELLWYFAERQGLVDGCGERFRPHPTLLYQQRIVF